ncbi:MAG TPA: bifunctional 2-C-methyl-D-erythritol 4-phosphate cytidylyltransferase/2-C-methyl-D-erythritol 2,4-cyclodiphosphate synthase [Campylobacterales bacterium]|nr:bifunctional 2-C-methyl-D-erythritol 4-phosphate cytidylyltransferase/2-C-methyl-D-erythritol 2,4-cyclodiphosphate synthase [Campylobacterales bacterium]
MSEISLILLAAGSSSRFGLATKKQWLRVGDKPLWLFVAKQFEKIADFKEIIVVGDEAELGYMQNYADYIFVAGGKERQDSLKNALALATSEFVMTADAARCCVDAECVKRVLSAKDKFDCVAPVTGVPDTTTLDGLYINRNNVKLIQTPQISKKDLLAEALSKSAVFTDDSGAMKSAGFSVGFVEGSKKQIKLTAKEDLAALVCLKPPAKDTFCGIGFDTHAFLDGGFCVLGGVKITDEYGFKAHSDGDVLIHSVIDALLGAAGLGDIGEFFPDTNPKYKGVNSAKLLKVVVDMVRAVGYDISNIDMTVVAEKPKLFNTKSEIKRSLASIMELPLYKICVKATTSEKMGFVGRGEGVVVMSVASLKFFDWMDI